MEHHERERPPEKPVDLSGLDSRWQALRETESDMARGEPARLELDCVGLAIGIGRLINRDNTESVIDFIDSAGEVFYYRNTHFHVFYNSVHGSGLGINFDGPIKSLADCINLFHKTTKTPPSVPIEVLETFADHAEDDTTRFLLLSTALKVYPQETAQPIFMKFANELNSSLNKPNVKEQRPKRVASVKPSSKYL